MAECKHQWEQEGRIRIMDRKGIERIIRSYRCQACGAICTDRDGSVPEGAKMVPEQAPHKPEVPVAPPAKKEEAMTEKKKEKNGETISGRKARSLADGWELGKIYRKTVKRRRDGKLFTCTMQVLKNGFKDQDGKIWDSPTALTTAFMNKKVGVKGRRPAKAFFADAPKARSIQTRPDCNKSKKPAAKPAAKRPAAKAAPAKAAPAKAEPAKAAPKPEPKVEVEVEKMETSTPPSENALEPLPDL